MIFQHISVHKSFFFEFYPKSRVDNGAGPSTTLLSSKTRGTPSPLPQRLLNREHITRQRQIKVIYWVRTSPAKNTPTPLHHPNHAHTAAQTKRKLTDAANNCDLDFTLHRLSFLWRRLMGCVPAGLSHIPLLEAVRPRTMEQLRPCLGSRFGAGRRKKE